MCFGFYNETFALLYYGQEMSDLEVAHAICKQSKCLFGRWHQGPTFLKYIYSDPFRQQNRYKMSAKRSGMKSHSMEAAEPHSTDWTARMRKCSILCFIIQSQAVISVQMGSWETQWPYPKSHKLSGGAGNWLWISWVPSYYSNHWSNIPHIQSIMNTMAPLHHFRLQAAGDKNAELIWFLAISSIRELERWHKASLVLNTLFLHKYYI